MIVDQPFNDPLWILFRASTKSEFLKEADRVTLSSTIIERTGKFAATGQTPLHHIFCTRVSQPITLTSADWEKIARTRKSKKLLATIKAHNRTKFHAFWFEYEAEKRPWWLLWFNLRDREPFNNHWRATGSPHAHMISYLTHPQEKIENYIEKISSDPQYNPPHSGAHIRFENDGWEDIAWG